MKDRKQLLVLGITAVYTLAYLLEFCSSPMCANPVLDGAEMMHTAAQMADGSFAMPFFRAPGYPLLLSLFLRIGFTKAALPFIASGIGALCHIVSAVLTGRISAAIFKNQNAAFTTGLLYGLHPVAVFYSAEPLDITPAITFFLSGLYFAGCAYKSGNCRKAVFSAFFMTTAFFFRPHFLPAVLATGIALLLAPTNKQKLILAYTIPVLQIFLCCGLLQYAYSGHFKIMPTQGGYNLWSANKPGANGRYYVQEIDFSEKSGNKENPAATEAELLYKKETGNKQASPVKISKYWKKKTFNYIFKNPGQWITLMLKKSYFFLNTKEQYNNKTFSFYKRNSAVLRWNPLSWGILISLAAVALLILHQRIFQTAVPLIFTGAFYEAGVLLFYVSARFRLPLAALYAILAGGIICISKPGWKSFATSIWKPLLASILVFLSFSRFLTVTDPKTEGNDMLLLSGAYLKTGDDEKALTHALQALEVFPENRAGKINAALSFYNLQLLGASNKTNMSWNDLADLFQQPPERTDLAFIYALAVYKSGNNKQAVTIWQQLFKKKQYPDALGALMLTGNAGTIEFSETISKGNVNINSPFLLAAIKKHAPEKAEEIIKTIGPDLFKLYTKAAERIVEN